MNLAADDTDEEIASVATPNGQEAPVAKRRPGRVPGSPKVMGSGRKKGGRNQVPAETREEVQELFRRRGPALFQRLFGLALGMKVRVGAPAGPSPQYVYPSIEQQMKAATILAAKIAPDLKSSETDVTSGGEPVTGVEMSFSDLAPVHGSRHVARAIMKVLREGAFEAKEEAHLKGIAERMEAGITSAEAADHPSSASGAADGEQASTSSASPDGFDHTFFTVVPGGKSEPSTPAPPVVGAFEELSGTGAGIELRSVDRDGNERWGVVDGRGALMSVHPSHEKAKAKCLELVEARRI